MTPHSIVFPPEWISQELPCRRRFLHPELPPPLGLSLTIIKERRERSQSVVSAGRACQISMMPGQWLQWQKITLWANKEDDQLPFEANEYGLKVKSRSQRKMQWPRPHLRLAWWGKGDHKCWWQVCSTNSTAVHPAKPLPLLCSFPSDSLHGFLSLFFSRFSLETWIESVKKRMLDGD